jgi:hypothetical protein
MSDTVVLIAIVWACVMTGFAFHYFVLYQHSLKGGARILKMLLGLATGDATMTKKNDGTVVFENEEHKMTMQREN